MQAQQNYISNRGSTMGKELKLVEQGNGLSYTIKLTQNNQQKELFFQSREDLVGLAGINPSEDYNADDAAIEENLMDIFDALWNVAE